MAPHPDTDELIARLCADYLDHLNGAPGHPRSELTALPLTPKAARRLRYALDMIDELHHLATARQGGRRLPRAPSSKPLELYDMCGNHFSLRDLCAKEKN